MSCSRKDCDNVMCSTYIPDVGYICSDCRKEFKESIKDDEIPQSEIEAVERLVEFLDTSATFSTKKEQINIDEFFNKYTK